VAAKALAANVRRLRKGRGWTQDVLAAEIAVEQAAVSLIENGRANPTLLVLESLAEKLDVRVDQLFEIQSKSKRGKDR
jgi:transcriptional regulator with XRE-family HTH domain